MDDFTALLAELRNATAAHGLLLTAALPASPKVTQHVDVAAVSGLLDWLGVS